MCACVFLFVIEEREVENGELEKERKEEHEKKINFFDKKFGAKYFEENNFFSAEVRISLDQIFFLFFFSLPYFSISK